MRPNQIVSRLKQIVGMNSYDDSTMLVEGALQLVENMRPQLGSLYTREGLAKYNSAVLPASGGVFGLGIYRPALSITRELAVSAGKLYVGTAGSFSQAYSGLDSTTLCTIVQFGGVALVVDQTTGILVYDSSANTANGDLPIYAYLAGVPSPKDYKLIDSFEAVADWTVTNGSKALSDAYFIHGTQSITFTSSGAVTMTCSRTLGAALDLTIHSDTSASTTSDYISIYILRGVPGNITNCYLDLGTDATFAAYYRYDLATHSDWMANNVSYVAFELKTRKSDFTTGAGAPNWNNIGAVRLVVVTSAAASIVADYLRLEKTGPIAVEVLGAEKVTNGTFTGGAGAPWVLNAGWTYNNNNVIRTGAGTATMEQNVTAVATEVYKVVYRIASYTDGSVTVAVGGDTGTARSAAGTYTEYLTATGAGNLIFTPTADSDFIIDDVSVKKVTTAGNLNGNYFYRLSFVTREGNESDSSLLSSEVVVSNGQVTLSAIPISGDTRIVRRKLYRLGGTSTLWQLLYGFEDNVQTTFTDNVLDTDLGAEYTAVEGKPYIPKTIAVQDDIVAIANLTTSDGIVYPSGVMVSESGSFEVYDHINFFEIEPRGGFGISWIHSWGGYFYVGRGNNIYKFDPKNLDIPPIKDTDTYCGAGPLAVCSGDNEFYFLDGNKAGVISCNGSSYTNIANEPGAPSKIKDYIELIPDAQIAKSWLRYSTHHQTLFVGIPQTGDTYPTIILAYYVPKRFWYLITGTKWQSRCGYCDGTTVHLGNAATGYVYNCFTGDDDDGTDISSAFWTRDDDFGTPELTKDYEKLFVFASGLVGEVITFTVTIYQDLATISTLVGTAVGAGFGHGAFGHGAFGHGIYTAETIGLHKRLELPTPQTGGPGTFLSVKVAAVKRYTLRGLVQVVRLSEPTF